MNLLDLEEGESVEPELEILAQILVHWRSISAYLDLLSFPETGFRYGIDLCQTSYDLDSDQSDNHWSKWAECVNLEHQRQLWYMDQGSDSKE